MTTATANQQTTTKPRKPPKLFSVSGTAAGVQTKLSAVAENKLNDSVEVLGALAQANDLFSRASALGEQIVQFLMNPTAKEETK